MNPQLLDYYNQELLYMRESAGEFAQMHPKIAKRLGMQGIEVADPYVERLIEAFCYMSARMRIKLDAEFPRFTQRLLEVIYPNYVSPTPSMAVVKLTPNIQEGDLSKGFLIPQKTALFSRIPDGEVTPCEFRTTQDVTLWPIEISTVQLAGVPPDIPMLQRHLPAHIKAEGSLRIRLKLNGELNFSQLTGLDRLPIYLCGEEQTASHLFEILHTSACASVVAAPGQFMHGAHVVTQNALVQEGMKPDESLLPVTWTSFHGHNLVHEYFSCPSRFYFFTLQNLAPGLKRIHGKEAEIVVILTREPSKLRGIVDAQQFSLFCTPVVNLFPRRTDRIPVDQNKPELHIVPDRSRPLDYEIFGIQKIWGQESEKTDLLEFRPMYHSIHQDEGNHGRYFSLRRETRLSSSTTRKYGTRTSYHSTEVFASLVDQHEAPYPGSLRYLSVESLLTNRDLPRLVPRNGIDDLRAPESLPIKSIGFVRDPSVPQSPLAQGEMAWRLIRQLSFNYLPLSDMPHREGASALRDMLRMFVSNDNVQAQKQIQSLIGSQVHPINRRIPGGGPIVYGRGVQCNLTIDEDGFSGLSPFLFGVVLEHYLAHHVAINVFAQTQLESMQRGIIHNWPVRMGGRGVV